VVNEPYTVGDWNGYPCYQCSACPFASLEEEVLLLHIAQRHQAPEATFRLTGLVDPSGNPILVKEA